MNKSDLTEVPANKANLTDKKAAEIVNVIFNDFTNEFSTKTKNNIFIDI